MRVLVPLIALLTACDVDDVDLDTAGTLPLAEDGAPPPRWHRFAFGQIVGGAPAGGAWTRLEPHAPVTFFVSADGPGDGPCAPSGAPCLDVLAPAVLGTVRADRDGVARFDELVPAGQTGPLWFQAAVRRSDGTWRVSEVVRRSIGVASCPSPGSQDVCAADRQVYASECRANAAGWPVLFAGPCP